MMYLRAKVILLNRPFLGLIHTSPSRLFDEGVPLGESPAIGLCRRLALQCKPKFWLDTALAQIAYLSFTCAIGVLFAYMIKGVGSKNHLLKGWFFAIISWFAVFAFY